MNQARFEKVPLKQVAFFQEGPGLRNWQWAEEGMKVINVSNIIGDGSMNISNTDKYVSLQEYETRYQHFAVEDGDVVVASSGNTYGKVGRVGAEHLPLMMNTSVIRFHPLDKGMLDDSFLYSFLRSPLFKSQVEQFVTGGAQPNFGPTHLKQMWIVLPSIDEQRAIVSVISPLDDLIENNRRRIALLEESARLLYREWFVHLRFPGHEHIKVTEGIPENWQCVATSEALEINPSTPRGDDGEIVYVPMAALSEIGMLIEMAPLESRQTSTSVRFRNGDTLFARITPCLENGKTGFVQFLASGEVACGSTEFIVLRGRRVSNYFVYLTARQPDFRENAVKSMIGSSGRQRVQPSCFDRYFVLIPPHPLALLFDDSVAPLLQQVRVLDQQNQRLAQARDLLLPRLMSGEVAV